MLTVIARALILFAAAVVARRLMGKRQVGQLQPFELVVVIMIAELAATPMGSVGVPLLYGILPMLALVICHGLLTFFSMKSERLRVWLCGRPTVLIRNGVICERQLRKTSFTLNDLMEELRMGGIQDPAEVATAVLETSGTVSVFPKADSRPVTPADMGLEVPAEGLPLPLVLDGHVNRANLQRGGLTEGWLNKALSALGYGSPRQVLFCCVNTQGEMMVQGKGKEQMQFLKALEKGQAGWCVDAVKHGDSAGVVGNRAAGRHVHGAACGGGIGDVHRRGGGSTRFSACRAMGGSGAPLSGLSSCVGGAASGFTDADRPRGDRRCNPRSRAHRRRPRVPKPSPRPPRLP